MEVPPQITNLLVQKGVEVGFRLFEGYLNTIQIHKPDSPQEEKPAGCQTCMIHQHVVLARGYIDGIVSRLNPDATVPAGLGGTIKQASEHLHEAMMEIPSVIGAHPAIDTACKELGKLLPEIAARLEGVQSRAEWELVQSQLKMAESVAYSIPEAVYRREYPEEKKDEQIVVILTPEQKEILDTLSAAKRGELPPEQARAKLNEILNPGEKHD